MATQLGKDPRVFPGSGGDERLQGPHRPTVESLGDVLGVASVAATQQSLNEPTGMGLIPGVPEQRRVAVEEAIQLGLQRFQLLLVHEPDLTGVTRLTKEFVFYPNHTPRRRATTSAL